MVLPDQKKTLVEKVLTKKVSVSSAARDAGVARKTIYEWIALYYSKPRKKEDAFTPRYQKGSDHPSAKYPSFIRKLKCIVVAHPQWSIRQYSTYLAKKGVVVSHISVYEALKRLDLTTVDARFNYSQIYSGPGRLEPLLKLAVVKSALSCEKTISELAQDYGVPRKTIYFWIKRYQNSLEQNQDSFAEKYVKGPDHPMAIYPEIEEDLLVLVANNPELSMQALAGSVEVSVWTVWKLLSRYNLNYKTNRILFSKQLKRRKEARQPVYSTNSLSGFVAKQVEILRLVTRKIPKISILQLNIKAIFVIHKLFFFPYLQLVGSLVSLKNEITDQFIQALADLRLSFSSQKEEYKSFILSLNRYLTFRPVYSIYYLATLILTTASFNLMAQSLPMKDSALSMQKVALTTVSDETSVQEVKNSFSLSLDDYSVSGSKNYKTSETLSFDIKKKVSVAEITRKSINKVLGTVDKSATDTPQVEIKDSGGNVVGGVELKEKSAGEFVVDLEGSAVKPGKYSLNVTGKEGKSVSQEFTWGTLAINTQKSSYAKGETVNFAMTVIGNEGAPVCDADLIVSVYNKNTGRGTLLTTSDGEIVVNKECSAGKKTVKPDYAGNIVVEDEGEYETEFMAVVDGRLSTVISGFKVTSDKIQEFEVVRAAPIRVGPGEDYPVIIKVKANRDYKGKMTDTLPKNFLVKPFGLSDRETYEQLGVVPESEFAVKASENNQIVIWDVDLKKGESYSFSYEFSDMGEDWSGYYLGPIAIDGKNVDERWELRPDPNMPVGNVVERMRYGNLRAEDRVLQLKNRKLKVSMPKAHFKAKETPSIKLEGFESNETNKTLNPNILQRILGYSSEAIDDSQKNSKIKITVADFSDNIEFETEADALNGSIDIPTDNLKPGKHTVTIRDNETGNFVEQTFIYGVLALNFNKTVYEVDESAYIQMASLDDRGNTYCSSNLQLTVYNPRNEMTVYKVQDETIVLSETCGANNVTDDPDYYIHLPLKEAGEYRLVLTNLQNGFSIDGSLHSEKFTDLSVERVGATRINPFEAKYKMTLRFKARQGFAGEIVEQVPADFEISKSEEFILIKEDNRQLISWEVESAEDKEEVLVYEYQAPKVTPDLFLLGPLELISADKEKTFAETRQWVLASDAVSSMILLWDPANGAVPSGWTCISCGSGNFYQKFIRGNADYNATGGGTATHTHTATGSVTALTGNGVTELQGSGSIDEVPHTHTYSPTIDSLSNFPLYRQLNVIQSDTAGEPATIPQYAIAFFDTAPPAGWTRYSAQDNYFIRGENAVATGGSNTHSHSVSGSTAAAVSTQTSGFRGGGTQVSSAATNHTHTVVGTSDTVDHQPPYITVYLASKDSAGAAPNGMIAMFNKTSADIYPTYWEDRSGSGQPFYQRFLKPDNGYGTTGGNTSHTHVNTSITSSQVSATQNGRSGTFGVASTHTHSVTVSNHDNPSHLPSYVDVALAEKNATIDVTGYLYESGTTTPSNLCTGTTVLSARIAGITYTASCSSMDGSFTFSQTAVPSAGDGLVIWIDGQTEKGATVSRYSGFGSSANNIVYESTLTVTSDNATAADIEDINFYDGDTLDGDGGDSDIPYSSTTTSLSVGSGIKLLVRLKSGVAAGSTVFDPGGTITTNVAGGDLHILDNAIAYLDTATNSIGRDVIVEGGATLYIDADTSVNGGNITLNDTGGVDNLEGTPTVTVSGTGIIGGGSGNMGFYNLATSGTGTTTLSGMGTYGLLNDLIIGSGTNFINSSAVMVVGNVSVGDAATLTLAANISINGGSLTTTLGGSVGYTNTPTASISYIGNIGGGSGSISFYNLDLGDGLFVGSTTIDSSLLQVDNSLKIGFEHALNMSSNSLTVGSTSVDGSGDISIIGSLNQSSSGTLTIKSSAGGTAAITGPGTFTPFNLTLGDGSNSMTVNASSGPTINIGGNLDILTGATLSAPASIQIGNDYTNSGTFTHNSGTITFNAQDSGNSLSGTMTGTNAFNNLVFDDTGATGAWTFNADAIIDGNFTLTGGNVIAPSGTLTVKGNFTNSDTFTNNSGTVDLAGAVNTTQTITGATSFYNLTATNSSTTESRQLKFTHTDTYTVSNALNFDGSGCTGLVVLRSTASGSQFTFSHSNTPAIGSNTLDEIDIQDMNWATAPTGHTNVVDSGNNSNITLNSAFCSGASTDTLNTATGHSFQRKVLFDSINSVYWSFYHDGEGIEPRASTNGSTWKSHWSPDIRLSYDTNDFSIFNKTISATESAVLAVKSGDDVVIRRADFGLSEGDPTLIWQSAVIALDGTSSSDSYSYPYVSLDSSNYIWVGARYYDGTNYVYKVVRSTEPAQSDWSAMAFSAVTQISDNQTGSNVYGNIVPLGSQDMYATFVSGTALEGCRWDNDDANGARWEDSTDADCAVISGNPGSQDAIDTIPTGVENNFSAVSDGTNVHLAFVDGTASDDRVSYNKYNGTSWGIVTNLDASEVSADGTDAYVSIGLNTGTDNGDLYVTYIDTANSHIYYRQYDASATSWLTEVDWKTSGINTNSNLNYSGEGVIFSHWTVGSATPYAIGSGSILSSGINSAPTVTNVSLNGGANIDLQADTTVNINFTATVTDPNGYTDISSVTGKMYRSEVGQACTPDNNNCYSVASCSLTNCSGNSCTATCTAPVVFFADATDAGTYINEYWLAWIQATDNSSATGFGYSPNDTTDMNSLLTIDTTPSIAYSNVYPDSVSTEKITTVLNAGNRTLDLRVSGNTMCTNYPTCSGSQIAVGNQEYSTSSFNYGSGTTLTTSLVDMDINIPKSSVIPSNSSASIYWILGVPQDTLPAVYTGSNTIISIASP